MKLNHLNLTVTDVGAAREFLETYFGLRCAATRGDSFAALSDDDGLFLTLMEGKKVGIRGPSTSASRRRAKRRSMRSISD